MSKSRKRTNNHHVFWPRREYGVSLARTFRQLPCLQVQIDIEVHALLHRLYGAPRKPDDDTMEYFILRHEHKACACYTDSIRTNILDY